MLSSVLRFLSPSLERSQIHEELNYVKTTLAENTLPQYKDIIDAKMWQGPSPFRTNDIKKFNNLIQSRTKQRDNYLVITTRVLSNMVDGIPKLDKEFERAFSNKAIDVQGLTYSKAVLLRVMSLMGFVGDYARMLLIYTYGKETPAAFKNQSAVAEPFNKAQLRYLEEHAANFARCLELFSEPMVKIIAKIEQIPNLVYDPKSEEAVRAQIGGKVDPLNLGFVPVVSRVFLFFGMRYAEYQAKRYIKAKRDMDVLQLRLAQLRAAQSNNPDAALEARINVVQEQLKDAEMDVADMEKKLEINQ